MIRPLNPISAGCLLLRVLLGIVHAPEANAVEPTPNLALPIINLPLHAQALGLNVNQFAQCLNSDKYSSGIRKDISDATNAGIQGTPNFVIALVDQKNPNATTIRVWQQIVGAQPYANYKAALDSTIAAAGR